jgi:hypothetical protein
MTRVTRHEPSPVTSIVGPQGLPAPQGPPGPAGPAGANGATHHANRDVTLVVQAICASQ